MSNNGKISIIIPVYNLEEYIGRTLDSVSAQTYENIEIVVVDDGSKDNSWNIICEYAKKDNRIVPIHQENGGVTSARLNGVKNATGEWIGFVDGDDLIDEDMYELLYNNAIKYNADISHCGYKMILGNKRIDYYYNTGCLVEQDNLKGLCDLLDGSMIEPGLWNKLFHNTLFHSLLHDGKMDSTIRNFEDLLMNYYLFKESKKSVFEDVCKYHYMVRNNSAATKKTNLKRFSDISTVFQNIKDDSGYENVKRIAFSRWVNYVSNETIDANPEVAREARKQLKQKFSEIRRSKFLSKKDLLLALMANDFYYAFYVLKKFYNKIKKTDLKYKVD